MENMVNHLQIKNFKSIKDLNLDCKRINVFVGKPNVGKSNILEALSLFGVGQGNYLGLNDFIRFEKLNNLFYDNIFEKDIKLDVDWGHLMVTYSYLNNSFQLFASEYHEALAKFKGTKDLNMFLEERRKASHNQLSPFHETYIEMRDGQKDVLFIPQIRTPVKSYKYTGLIDSNRTFYEYLTPPFGENLPAIIQSNKELRTEIVSYFAEYGLEFVFRAGENKVEIQKNVDGFVTAYPYSLTADTLQRMIFYLAAIKSNKNSVLLFEEPETHTFPSYTTALAYNIVASKDNQFFITTHNPYLLDTILEESNFEETAVFKVSYKDYQTHAVALTEEEIEDIVSYGADVFINHKAFGN